MQYNFPSIKTTRSAEQQAQKIVDEHNEYLEEFSDEEAVDILHATETFIRVHFKGREDVLNMLINQVTTKNQNRGYYEKKCY